jgi:hypothetical protein
MKVRVRVFVTFRVSVDVGRGGGGRGFLWDGRKVVGDTMAGGREGRWMGICRVSVGMISCGGSGRGGAGG